MKLQMMTHGDPHQYDEGNETLMSMYQSPNGSPYYQTAEAIAQQQYFGKYYPPVATEYSFVTPTTSDPTSNSMPSENHAATMSNDDLFRAAEEQLRPLIKEELRHTIQCKRVAKGLPSHVEIEYKVPQREPETPVMLLKRQRRRDRNKIAAAKCRFKKKLLSEKLVEESEQLEAQNQKLKTEVQRLQDERQKLMYILNLHRPTCIVRSPSCSSPPHSSTSEPRSTSSSPGFSRQHREDFAAMHKMSLSSRSSSLDDDAPAAPTSTFTYPPFASASRAAHRSVIVRSDSVQGTS